jgi:hypothetical protein
MADNEMRAEADDSITVTPTLELRPGVPIEDLRRDLREARHTITVWTNELMINHRLEQLATSYWERVALKQDMAQTAAHRDFLLSFEAAVCEELQRRGERVPRWRNRPK